MPVRPPNALYAYIGAFVEELARSGLRNVCICPGSRSTPLALCIARHPSMKVWMHLDERSAAFFALGLAKADRQPVALLCTSGTAAANFMPAVVEARLAHVPLLVLTADRPPELREVGAPQTIDQIRLYGSHVKWSVEMATPGASEDLLRYARTIGCRSVATALALPRGPVHLNFPLREPLTPVEAPGEIPATISEVALYGRPDGEPYVQVTAPPAVKAPSEQLGAFADLIIGAPEGLIVCGPLDEEAVGEQAVALASAAGYPILADPLSGLRAGPHSKELIVDAYDAILRGQEAAASLIPTVIVRFGAIPTSKPLLQYLQRHHASRQIVVTRAGWQDPTLLADSMVDDDPAAFCDGLAGLLRAARANGARLPEESRWLRRWQTANRRAREALSTELDGMDELFEGRVFPELRDLLPEGATLWAGSSMPVRDLDTFFPSTGKQIRILANRGANGIDGVVSSALGAAASESGPTVLVLGDISFYHDMNGLFAAARHGLNLTVVLLNNDGGGIFSFLPQATEPAFAVVADGGESLFEKLFGTPHGLDFAHVGALYGAVYTRVGDWPAFRKAVQTGIDQGGLHIVEVPTDRERNVVLHRRCWPAVARALP